MDGCLRLRRFFFLLPINVDTLSPPFVCLFVTDGARNFLGKKIVLRSNDPHDMDYGTRVLEGKINKHYIGGLVVMFHAHLI